MSRPCLVVGLGGIGWRAAAACREAYHQIPEPYRLPASFLGIDLRAGQGVAKDDDLVLLSAAELREVLAHLDTLVDGRPAWSTVHDWFPDRQIFAHVPEQPEGTGLARPLGRLSLWIPAHTELVRGALWRRLEELRGRAGSHDDRRPDVILIASAWGGTGSALALDVASLVTSLTPIGRQDVYLVLPQDLSSSGPGAASFENTYATLIDFALAPRFPQRVIKVDGPPTIDLVRERGRTLSPYVVLRPNLGRSSAVATTLAEIVTARLRRSLALALADRRQRTARVHFLPRPIRWLSRLRSSAAASLPLIRIEQLLPNLETVLSEELVAQGLEQPESTTADGSAPESMFREFESAVEVLIQKQESLHTQVKALLEAEEDRKAHGDEKDRLHLLLEEPAEIDNPKELHSLLDALGSSALYHSLERSASELGGKLAEFPAELVGSAFLDQWRQLKKRLKEQHQNGGDLEPRRRAWKLCVEEILRFERALDNLQPWRRLPVPARVHHRNAQIKKALIVESIELHDWQHALDSAIQVGALLLLKEHLPLLPITRGDLEATLELTPEPVGAEPVDEVTTERELEALRHFIAYHQEAAPTDAESISARLRSCVDSFGSLFLPDPGAKSLDNLIASCRTDAFAARAASPSFRSLTVLLPEGLIWPEGEDALIQVIQQQAKDALGVRAEIIRGPSDKIVCYVEESDQPLQNLEPLAQYQSAYSCHPHPSTLHIDRRWVESEDGRRLLEGLQPESGVQSDGLTMEQDGSGETLPGPTH